MGKYEADRGQRSREKRETSSAQTQAVKAETTRKAPTPQQIASRQKAARNQRIAIIGACSVALLVLIIVIICLLMNTGSADDGKILDNVYAAGVDLSGMTKDEARNALQLATGKAVGKKDMVIVLPDGVLELSPEDTHPSVDVDAVVDAAYDYGRTGSEEEQAAIREGAKDSVYTIALLPYMKDLDLNYIYTTIDSFCTARGDESVPPTVTVSGERPTYDPEHPDRSVVHQVMTITIGSPDYELDTDDLYAEVLDAYSLNETEVHFGDAGDMTPEGLVAQEIFDEYCAYPQNAAQDEQTYEVTPEVYGYGFDIDQVQELIDNADFGQVLEIELEFLHPDVTAEDLRDGLFDVELGDMTTTAQEDSVSRNNNLKVSCEALDGLIIGPGDTFSFNKALGRPTAQQGYKQCAGYVDGVLTDIMGGGIDQTASTLYYCALMADLDILERTSNGYAVSYIDPGLDVCIDWGIKDLKFVNNTEGPIRIDAKASGNSVSIQLVGSEELSYTVEIITEELECFEPETVYQKMDKDNIHGYTDGTVLEEGITGYLVQTSVEKTHKQTHLVISTTLVDTSKYDKRDQKVVKIEPSIGVGDLDPTEPTDPTVPEEPVEAPEA